MSVSAVIDMGKSPSGHPTVNCHSCSAGNPSVSVNFNGAWSWLYNMFTSRVEGPIRDSIKGIICSEIPKIINSGGNEALGGVPLNVVVAGMFDLDYSLVSAPVFTADSVDFNLKGEFFGKGDKTEAPFQPQPMPNPPGPTKMVTFFLSDYVINTLGHVVYQYGSAYTTQVFTKQDLPVESRHYLDTNNYPMLPPNGSIELHMTLTDAPSLNTKLGETLVRIQGQAGFKVRQTDGTTIELVSVDITLDARVNFNMIGKRIAAILSNFTVDTNVTTSYLGDMAIPDDLDDILNLALVDYVAPRLQEIAGTGIELPSMKGVDYNGPQIYQDKGTVMFTTNIKYIPG